MEWATKLLENLPLTILLILAIIFCGADLIKAIGVWRKAAKNKISKEIDEETKLDKVLQEIHKLREDMDQHGEAIGDLNSKIQALTVSDMHDIKSWIVDQYHKFMAQGWIDAFSAETIERRYEDYSLEGGNSYIAQLVSRLRELPMDPTGVDDR